MRALVTGAAGFIGSHLVDRLLADGWEVVGMDSLDPYYDPAEKRANLSAALRHPLFRLHESSIAETGRNGALDGEVRACDAVFHLAGQPGVRGSWGGCFRTYEENNTLATQTLLESCKGAPLTRLVNASSSSVYGDCALPMREDSRCAPFSPYGVTKLAAENLCGLYARNHDVPAVSLRLFSVYGPRQRPDMAFRRFMSSIREGEEASLLGDGEQTRDFTHVSDVVDALVLALDAPSGETFNVGGGSQVTLKAALDVLASVCGARPILRFEPAPAGDVRGTLASLEKVRALGYSPKVGLAEGLARQWDWECARL